MTPQDITSNLNQIVSYKNVLHKLKCAIIEKDEQGNIYYLAGIQDLNANSFGFVRLEAVDVG